MSDNSMLCGQKKQEYTTVQNEMEGCSRQGRK